MKPKNKNADNSSKQKVTTPVFRVSYPHVFKPQSLDPKSAPKYSVTMLFPKKTDLTGLKNAITAAKIAAYGPKKEEWPKNLHSPIQDGDEQSDRAGYAGHYVVKASCKEEKKPGIVDADGKTIITLASDFYAGCYARAIVFAVCYDFMGKKGVTLVLDHLQKARDGKPLSSKKPVEQAFAPIEEDETIDDEDAGDDDSEEEKSDDDEY